jgi:Sulfatase
MSRQGRPNIVFVLCDNVGWGDFGVYGGGTATPRIDQLAGEGIRFNNYTVAVLTKDASDRQQGEQPTPPIKGCFVIPRLCNPLQSFSGKTWRSSEIQPV